MVYLDNNATTRPDPRVLEAARPFLEETWGNPSSRHRLGIEAERGLETAREHVARLIHAKPTEVVFTSGGTEAINLAIRGLCRARRRKGTHIVATSVEHPAVLETLKDLESDGFTHTLVGVDETGCVTGDDVKAAMTDSTILVCIMHVNNEVGGINPIEDIARKIKGAYPEVTFFSDGVQALGKIDVDLAAGIDLYAISGHKIHAPKGTGALIVREKTRILPIVTGGAQEKGLHSGTENVAGFVALGAACTILQNEKSAFVSHMSSLKTRLVAGLKNIEGSLINSPETGVCGTVNVSFPGARAEVLLHALEEKDVYVSTGAACSSKKKKSNYVLEACGFKSDRIESAIRLSLSRESSELDIDQALEAIQKALHDVRLYR